MKEEADIKRISILKVELYNDGHAFAALTCYCYFWHKIRSHALSDCGGSQSSAITVRRSRDAMIHRGVLTGGG